FPSGVSSARGPADALPRRCPELPSVRRRGDSRVALEEAPEERAVLVADPAGDLLHRDVLLLEQTLGGADAKALQVVGRREAGGALEPADEVARAHAELAGEQLEPDLLAAMAVNPLLGAPDGGIGLLPPQRGRPGGSAANPAGQCGGWSRGGALGRRGAVVRSQSFSTG